MRKHRSQHITFYQQPQGGGLPEGQLHNGSQSFLSLKTDKFGFSFQNGEWVHDSLRDPKKCRGPQISNGILLLVILVLENK